MAIGSDVRTYLLTLSAVTSVVGNRIYAGTAPEHNSTYPFIVFAIIGQEPQHHLANGADWSETTISFDVYCNTASSRETLVEVLRNALQGYRGSMGSSTVNSVTYESQFDLYMRPEDQSDLGSYRSTVNYWFRHQVTTPTHA